MNSHEKSFKDYQASMLDAFLAGHPPLEGTGPLKGLLWITKELDKDLRDRGVTLRYLIAENALLVASHNAAQADFPNLTTQPVPGAAEELSDLVHSHNQFIKTENEKIEQRNEETKAKNLMRAAKTPPESPLEYEAPRPYDAPFHEVQKVTGIDEGADIPPQLLTALAEGRIMLDTAKIAERAQAFRSSGHGRAG